MGTVQALMFDFNGTLSQDEPLLGHLPAALRHARPAARGGHYYSRLAGLRRRRSSAAGSASTARRSHRSLAERIAMYAVDAADGATVTEPVREAVRYAAARVRSRSSRRVQGRDRAGGRGRRDRGASSTRSSPPTTSHAASPIPRATCRARSCCVEPAERSRSRTPRPGSPGQGCRTARRRAAGTLPPGRLAAADEHATRSTWR